MEHVLAKTRIGYIDIAKAIAIFFIIWGHYGGWDVVGEGLPRTITNMAYTFHVELFFIASGFFIKPERAYNLKKEAKSLLTPYVVSCLFIIVINAVLAHFRINGDYTLGTLQTWVVNALYGAGDGVENKLFGITGFIGGLWFLLALFWGRMFLFATHKLPHPALWLAGLFAAGWLTRDLVWLPFSIQSGMCAALYLYIGHLCAKHKLFDDGAIPKPLWLCAAVIWASLIFTGSTSYPVSNNYPLGVLNVIGAIAGSFCTIAASKWIERHLEPVSKFLQLVGRNTLPIFCVHIIDMDCFPIWLVQNPIQAVTGLPMGYITIVLHLLVIAAACLLLYVAPRPLSSVYYPKKRGAS